jgi:hypothetical protein
MIIVIFNAIAQVVAGMILVLTQLFTNIIYIFWDEQMTLFGLLILIAVGTPIVLYGLHFIWALLTGWSFKSWNIQRKFKNGDLKVRQTGHIFGKGGLKVEIKENTNWFK